MVPLTVRALPAQRNHVVQLPTQARGAVTRCRYIGDSPEVEEHRRDREIRGDRKDIPDQWRLEVRPEKTRVRVRDEPIGMPHPPNVNQREESRGHHSENRHGLRSPIDGLTPWRAEQEQNRRNQRSGVGDTNPEHEGGDVDTPTDWRHQATDADALVDLVEPGSQEHADARHGQPEEHPPHLTGGGHHLQDIAVYIIETLDVRMSQGTTFSGSRSVHRHQPCPPDTSWNVTFFR